MKLQTKQKELLKKITITLAVIVGAPAFIAILFMMFLLFLGLGANIVVGHVELINDTDHEIQYLKLDTDAFHDNPARDPADISAKAQLASGAKTKFSEGVECIFISGDTTPRYLPQMNTEYSTLFAPRNTYLVSQILRSSACPYQVEWIENSHWTCHGGKLPECTRDEE